MENTNIKNKDLICITCPIGCLLHVDMKDTEIFVSGNACKRGEVYGIKEVTAPTRTVTSTVTLSGAAAPVLSVKTRKDIPKDKIFDCMLEICTTKAAAPIKVGDIIISNVASTGIDIVSTMNAAKKERM